MNVIYLYIYFKKIKISERFFFSIFSSFKLSAESKDANLFHYQLQTDPKDVNNDRHYALDFLSYFCRDSCCYNCKMASEAVAFSLINFHFISARSP